MSVQSEKIEETIEITNMTCRGCARTIENELRKFEGIEYAVNLPGKTVTVCYSPRQYSLMDFEKVIESHGYRIKGNIHK
jgi:copper chaperone CopZ